ncbi:MAG: alpha/beta fold hydrolase [Myxococcota bacterium]
MASLTRTPLANRPFTLEGAGGAALLVHGLGGGTYELQWLGEALHARLGITVRAMHLPGHEAPMRAMPPSRHEDWVAAVERELDALGPAHLVGFSTGALVALRVAQRRPLTGRLVLLAPFIDIYRPPLLPVRPEALLEKTPWLSQVPRRPPPLRDATLRALVTAVLPFSTMNLDAVRSAKALSDAVLTALPRVTAPTLVLQGAKDTVVDPSGAARVAAGVRGARLVMLDDSDHLLVLDGQRDVVVDEVVVFLR